ncbi:Protein ZBED8 [Chionoecetes opilio]|uniref:Protein ZBED8 n=1 Tax=Chionoecetes opilio TaxID=41210 RepID=A0A8J5CSE2_CHIOP|nr:Protein ZBED8 [Chionoecetes opilio]
MSRMASLYSWMIVEDQTGHKCMTCHLIICNSNLKPARLREHQVKHPTAEHKQIIEALQANRATYDQKVTLPRLGFKPVQKSLLQASYEGAYQCIRKKASHLAPENLVKPCTIWMVELVPETEAAKKMKKLPLSNDVTAGRIANMSCDILDQIVQEIKDSPISISLQLDESIDVSNMSQMILYTRYIKDGEIKDEFLFCEAFNNKGSGCISTLGREKKFVFLRDALRSIRSKKVEAFKKKLSLWNRRNQGGNMGSSPLLDEKLRNKTVSPMLVENLVAHLSHLETTITKYLPKDHTFPEWIPQPFLADMSDADSLKEELIDLQRATTSPFTTPSLLLVCKAPSRPRGSEAHYLPLHHALSPVGLWQAPLKPPWFRAPLVNASYSQSVPQRLAHPLI